MPREFLSQVEEVKFFQRNPHLTPPGGYQAIPDYYHDELEYLPQDKSNTLDYKLAHEELCDPKSVR